MRQISRLIAFPTSGCEMKTGAWNGKHRVRHDGVPASLHSSGAEECQQSQLTGNLREIDSAHIPSGEGCDRTKGMHPLA